MSRNATDRSDRTGDDGDRSLAEITRERGCQLIRDQIGESAALVWRLEYDDALGSDVTPIEAEGHATDVVLRDYAESREQVTV